MIILALDLATDTGWALWDGSRRESGVQKFEVKRGESPGMRFLRFNRWLDDVATPGKPIRMHLSSAGASMIERSPGPRLIVFEQAHHRGGHATEVGVGLSTRVLEFCAKHDIEHAAVHSATLKKWTTGKGNAKKPEMISAVNERFGPPYAADDNECDARALLAYALSELVSP